jgi:hypothetical protein
VSLSLSLFFSLLHLAMHPLYIDSEQVKQGGTVTMI